MTNQIVWLLAKPSQVQDTSWIKPGKVAWDWWNAKNIYGVDFKSGINTQTYKYYIDFAAKYGIQYIILDEGWYKLGNLLEVVPDINMEELVPTASRKMSASFCGSSGRRSTISSQPALDQFEKWGVKGIKVDFMQRSDQVMINFYHKICREAAKRKMLVDFHGAIRAGHDDAHLAQPDQHRRRPGTWSGISGARKPNPSTTSRFPSPACSSAPWTTRRAPCAMRTRETFEPIATSRWRLGTRCHQLAMYVVFESPLQMLGDTPSNYLREPEIMEFLAPVPTFGTKPKSSTRSMGTTWLLLAAADGMVRRRDDRLDRRATWISTFRFCRRETFRMQSYEDGANADRMAQRLQDDKDARSTTNTRLKIKMAAGGGWAARLVPQ